MRLSTIVLGAAGLLYGSAVMSHDFTYVSGGIYDVGDSDMYLEGSINVNPNLVLNAQYTNAGRFNLYAGAKYFTDFIPRDDVHSFLQVGVSHYDIGWWAEDTGAYAGIGAYTDFDAFSRLIVDARYDTVFDGFLSTGVRFRYLFQDNIAADIGLRVNTGGMDNEFRVGLTYQF